jgi:probable addiction module antidote protein
LIRQTAEDKEDIEWFLADALRANDAAFVAHCLGVATRSSGMRQIAKETGLSREQLYRSLSAEGNPTLKTVLAVINSLGLELTAKAQEIDAEEARVKPTKRQRRRRAWKEANLAAMGRPISREKSRCAQSGSP